MRPELFDIQPKVEPSTPHYYSSHIHRIFHYLLDIYLNFIFLMSALDAVPMTCFFKMFRLPTY